MENIIDDYIYVHYTDFDKLNANKKNIHVENNSDYILIDNINNKKRKLSLDVILSHINSDKEICITIDSNYFFNSIRNSFPNYNKIWEQFLKDIERCECYLNNNIIDGRNLFIFEDYLKSNFTESKMYEIIMLCTQAVMAYPFEIIQNSLKDKYLSEITNKKKYDLLQIFIYKESENVTFNIKKRMRIFKLDKDCDDITTEYVVFNLDFNLDYEKYILMKINIEKI